MNRTETAELLAFVARIDNRRHDDATVLAWWEILNDLPAADCHEAAQRHFATSDAYLMPVHIRRGADEVARERIRAINASAHARAIEAEHAQRQHTEDRSDDVAQLVADLRRRLGDYDRNVLRRAEWVREDRLRQRAEPEPNPHYVGPPPPGGHPVPEPEPTQEPR